MQTITRDTRIQKILKEPQIIEKKQLVTNITTIWHNGNTQNPRRKVAHHVLNSAKTVTIKHDIITVEIYFSQVYETPNNRTLDTYIYTNNRKPDDFIIKLSDIQKALLEKYPPIYSQDQTESYSESCATLNAHPQF